MIALDQGRRRDVYLEAARRIAEADPFTDYACVMIHAVAEGVPAKTHLLLSPMMPHERVAFAEVFKPTDTECEDDGDGAFRIHRWLQKWKEHDGHPDAVHRRVVALCLAAAMSETGDL